MQYWAKHNCLVTSLLFVPTSVQRIVDKTNNSSFTSINFDYNSVSCLIPITSMMSKSPSKQSFQDSIWKRCHVRPTWDSACIHTPNMTCVQGFAPPPIGYNHSSNLMWFIHPNDLQTLLPHSSLLQSFWMCHQASLLPPTDLRS